MTSADETTPLLQNDNSLLTDQSPPRIYKKQSKSFYLCVLVSILVLILIAGAVTVWYILQNSSNASNSLSEAEINVPYLLPKKSYFRPDEKTLDISYIPTITLLNDAVNQGKRQLQAQQAIENDSDSVPIGSPTYKHQKAILSSAPATKLSDYGYVEISASEYLRSKNVKNDIHYASILNFKWTNESECYRRVENITCKSTAYRSIDGSCNNLNHPLEWGVAMTPFRRCLPAEYDDGVSAPRGGYNTTLPSARDISTQVHRSVYEEDYNFTVMLAVWGQFIDHDITATAISKSFSGKPISCCNAKLNNTECFPVILSPNDKYYSKYNITCMEFVRSAPALRCTFGSREQLNQVSSYLDGSMVYGNIESLAEELRTFNNGELRMSLTNEGRYLLPVSTDPQDGCNQAEEIMKKRYCFLSGDSRANENTHLTTMHLVFARQHNYIAGQLYEINPWWDDETIYQETRRILIAQIQHITYKEFLPNILGSKIMTRLKLYPQTDNYWKDYNISMDTSISNNFATSSFRFAHTLIPGMMKILANDTSSPEYIEMHKMLFNPYGLYDGELDSILRGVFNTPIERADNHFTDEVTNHLFESLKTTNSTKNSVYGLDLVALNIQRGRDHGLPSYTKWREYCGLSSVTSFEDLHGIFDKQSLQTIVRLYNSVNDIDLYTGSLSEYPISDGLVGPTLTCLLTEQFYRLKYGDRFWYETDEQPQAFTPEQLREIRKTSLAGIICQNADDLQTVSTEVMKLSNDHNKAIFCTQISKLNFTVWRKQPEEYCNLNVSEIRINNNDFDFIWYKGFNANIPSNYFENGRLMNIIIKNIQQSHNETHAQGTFVYENAINELINGKFDIKMQTCIPFDILNSKIKLPIYINNGFTQYNITNTSRIVLNTNSVSDEYFSWNGSVTIMIASYWNTFNVTQLNKIEKISFKNIKNDLYYPNITNNELNSYGGIKSWNEYEDKMKKFRIEDKNKNIATRYNETTSRPNKNNDWISTGNSKDTNFSLWQKNIFHKILQSEKDNLRKGTLNKNENKYSTDKNTVFSTNLDESIYTIKVSADNVEIIRKNGTVILLPTKLSIDNLKDKIIIWNFTLPNSLHGHFVVGNESGTFKVKYENMRKGETLFKSGCNIYSKIIFDNPINGSDLFNINVTSLVNECSVIAPLLLHGRAISSSTFSWNGNVTIFVRQSKSTLEKEEELSLYSPPKRIIKLENISGTLTIGNEIVWNETIPVLRNLKNNRMNWILTNDTAVYPVFWCGEYENSTFIGHFLLPDKLNKLPSEGIFSVNLASVTFAQEFIKPNEIYESIVYLTENPSTVQNIDTSEFNKIDNWDSNNYFKIILVGKFREDIFVWSGKVILTLPEQKMTYSSKSSAYRPEGKYLVKILEATVFAVLKNNFPIKWWSNIVPPKVLIPAKLGDEYTYKHIFNDAIVWTFEPSNASDGHATFRTYGNQSRIILFGDFEFETTSLFKNIKTSNLQPNVTYFSPLILQNDNTQYDIDKNLVNSFITLSMSEVGIFAPIILLGNYVGNGTLRLFEWNLKCIILLDDETF